MRAILLNPGPVSLSEAVRKAAVSADLCHREPEFFELQARVRNELLGVYGCDGERWAAVLLGGSGTAALEAMLTSLPGRQARLLVIENGVYGERIGRVAQIHGIDHQTVKFGWTGAIDFGRVGEALSSGTFTHLAAVHHETTTGRLNDVAHLARLCEQHGVQLLLDAVSSFGAEAIPFDSPALVGCAATANKCLHGIPGLCLVIVRRSALFENAEAPRSLYLDLSSWLAKQDQDSTPFTPPVNAVLALDKALQELRESGGWQRRQARYLELAGRVRRALVAHGVETLLPEAESSSALVSYRIPAGMTYAAIHDGLKQWGFVIYAGQGALAQELFRISTMGDITDYDMERLMAAIDSVFLA